MILQTRSAITLDSTTSHGGRVIPGPGARPARNGHLLATEDDMIDCPDCGIRGYIVCNGLRNPGEVLDGKPLVLDGDLCICGCWPPPRLKAS